MLRVPPTRCRTENAGQRGIQSINVLVWSNVGYEQCKRFRGRTRSRQLEPQQTLITRTAVLSGAEDSVGDQGLGVVSHATPSTLRGSSLSSMLACLYK